MRNNLKTPLNGTDRYTRRHWVYHAWKPKLNELGFTLGQAIKENDPNIFLDYLNEHIHEFHRIHNWTDLFGDKFPQYESIYSCSDCNRYEYSEDLHDVYNGDRSVCSHCIDDYCYSEYSETYISADEYQEEIEMHSRAELIGNYHSTEIGKIPSLFDKRPDQIFLGLELEIEVSESVSRYDKAKEVLDGIQFLKSTGREYCGLENDGSLNNGFEIVTGYTGLDIHESQLEFFKKPIRGIRSHDSRTCGLHVHIDKRGVSLAHATKMILFINDSGNQRLIKAIARRTASSYAEIKNKKADYRWLKDAKSASDKLSALNSDNRYEALNFQNEKTIEFRLFKGTLKFESIMACLEFTYATWHFTKQAGMRTLTIQDFINFICMPENLKDTKYLRAYLKAQHFDVSPIKNNPRITSENEVTSEI